MIGNLIFCTYIVVIPCALHDDYTAPTYYNMIGLTKVFSMKCSLPIHPVSCCSIISSFIHIIIIIHGNHCTGDLNSACSQSGSVERTRVASKWHTSWDTPGWRSMMMMVSFSSDIIIIPPVSTTLVWHTLDLVLSFTYTQPLYVLFRINYWLCMILLNFWRGD